MRYLTTTSSLVMLALSLSACSKNAPEASAPDDAEVAADSAQDESTVSEPLETPAASEDRYFVEGVAGGVMVRKVQLQVEVLSVDRENRQVVVRGPQGNEFSVKVGRDAVNFYQVQVGDRVDVMVARELLIYVPDAGEDQGETPDGTAVAEASAAEGEQPAGMMVASTKITAKIKAMDIPTRKATLVFEDGSEETFDVRPDVTMENYQVGQDVVFLITDFLALQVRKI